MKKGPLRPPQTPIRYTDESNAYQDHIPAASPQRVRGCPRGAASAWTARVSSCQSAADGGSADPGLSGIGAVRDNGRLVAERGPGGLLELLEAQVKLREVRGEQ